MCMYTAIIYDKGNPNCWSCKDFKNRNKALKYARQFLYGWSVVPTGIAPYWYSSSHFNLLWA